MPSRLRTSWSKRQNIHPQILRTRRKTKDFARAQTQRAIDEGILNHLDLERIRNHARLLFNNHVYHALSANTSPNDKNIRALKALTAICIEGTTLQEQKSYIDIACRDHPQALLLRRVAPHKTGAIRFFEDKSAIALTSHRQELASFYPFFDELLESIAGYSPGGHCFLERYLDPYAPIAPQIKKEFDRLPNYTKRNGILRRKELEFAEARLRCYRAAEGTVCCIALTGLIDLLLTQLHCALKLPGGRRPRPPEILHRLESSRILSASTLQRLRIVFPDSNIGLRDMLSHGIFAFRELDRLDSTLNGLTYTLDGLMRDVRQSLSHEEIFAEVRGATICGIAERRLIEEAAKRSFRSTITSDPHGLVSSGRSVHFLDRDKSFQYDASVMLWGEIERGENIRRASFYGLILALTVAEDLIRAIYQIAGVPVISITREQNSVRCEYSMLEPKDSALLDPALLTRVFGDNQDLEPLCRAAKFVRDTVMHGRWIDLAGLTREAFEVILKLNYTLATAQTAFSAAQH